MKVLGILLAIVLIATTILLLRPEENELTSDGGFGEALEAGAHCAELYEIHDSVNLVSLEVYDIDERLSAVGCDSALATRSR